jgi:hypothetical protein
MILLAKYTIYTIGHFSFWKTRVTFKCLTKALFIIMPYINFYQELTPFKDVSKSLKVKTWSKELGRQGKSPFLRITHDTCHFYDDV